MNKNTCDFGHDTYKEVRVLPYSNDGNMIICYKHYLQEMKNRRERNQELEDFAKYDLPKWEDLKIYEFE